MYAGVCACVNMCVRECDCMQEDQVWLLSADVNGKNV